MFSFLDLPEDIQIIIINYIHNQTFDIISRYTRLSYDNELPLPTSHTDYINLKKTGNRKIRLLCKYYENISNIWIDKIVNIEPDMGYILDMSRIDVVMSSDQYGKIVSSPLNNINGLTPCQLYQMMNAGYLIVTKKPHTRINRIMRHSFYNHLNTKKWFIPPSKIESIHFKEGTTGRSSLTLCLPSTYTSWKLFISVLNYAIRLGYCPFTTDEDDKFNPGSYDHIKVSQKKILPCKIVKDNVTFVLRKVKGDFPTGYDLIILNSLLQIVPKNYKPVITSMIDWGMNFVDAVMLLSDFAIDP